MYFFLAARLFGEGGGGGLRVFLSLFDSSCRPCFFKKSLR